MSKGFLLFADGDKYVIQACLSAMSIGSRNNLPISIVTNDIIPKKYEILFDKIIRIPWTEFDGSRYKILNRWKTYHVSPYDETIVFDTDTLVLQDLNLWWDFFKNYDLFYLNKVYTYRSKVVVDNYYRKAFSANYLPNLYSGLHYFKKSNKAKEFFSWLELISKNWELFYGHYCKEFYPKQPSMDLSVAIASKILNNDTDITNNTVNFLKFVHMKPCIQEWQDTVEHWQDKVGVYITKNLDLYIGNYLQTGIFHYASDRFVNDIILKKYEDFLGL